MLWSASWLAPRFAAAARGDGMLDAEQSAVVQAIADTLIVPVEDEPTPEEVDVVGSFAVALSNLDPFDASEPRKAIGLIESPWFGFIMDLRPSRFTTLDLEGRTAALLAWRDSRLEVRRSAYKVLRTVVVASYYGAPETYGYAGYPGPPEIAR